MPCAADEGVGAAPAVEAVVAVAAVELVVAGKAKNHVIAAAPLDPVRSVGAGQEIVALGADDGRRREVRLIRHTVPSSNTTRSTRNAGS